MPQSTPPRRGLFDTAEGSRLAATETGEPGGAGALI
jgi:hypothetical protein